MPTPLVGSRPMTPAERQQRYRARKAQKASLEALHGPRQPLQASPDPSSPALDPSPSVTDASQPSTEASLQAVTNAREALLPPVQVELPPSNDAATEVLLDGLSILAGDNIRQVQLLGLILKRELTANDLERIAVKLRDFADDL
jgi:hypothetical protein